MKKLISFIICGLLIVSALTLNAAAASASVSYVFTGADQALAGYAEGTITLKAPVGTYFLFWADDTKALDGYSEIAALSVGSSGSATHKMAYKTAVPADATKLIAVTSKSDKSVKNAAAVYTIPASKRFPKKTCQRNYRFASFSDIHIDGVYKTYNYADEHLRCAFDTAAARDSDFVAMSGDYVNNNIDYKDVSTYEWKNYQRILSESDYCNPVYEAIGNHELWQSVSGGTADFIKATGLDGDKSASSCPYFEKTLGGDHFIFMALEGGFYPDKTEEFTDAQLDWVEGLLKKYSGDGRNIYIIEHSLFYKYGAGDRIDPEPYYDIPLKDSQSSAKRLKQLLNTYKDVIFLSGHTHIAFKEQYNYSDNSGTSCQMIHNSSVGGTRPIVNGSLDRSYPLDQTEGYIVDVFDEGIVFNGANLYYNLYDPNCCYLVKPSKSFSGNAPASTGASATNYYVKGSFNGWGTSDPLYTTSASNVYQTTIRLSAGTHTFKIFNGSWYGNNGTIEDTTEKTSAIGWEMKSSEGNCTLKATGGYYTFNYNTSSRMLKLFYSATDPNATQPSEPTSSESQPTSPPEPQNILSGDANLDGKVTIRDATTIQLRLAKRLDFSASERKAADVDLDNDININDVTYIQEYLAGIIKSFAQIAPPSSESTRAQAKNALGTYYRYSSYDCYQALKKAYRFGSTEARLSSLTNALLEKVDKNNVDQNITVCFEKPDGWGAPNAYVWGRKGAGFDADWPGKAMTYVGKNGSGKQIYKYTITNQRRNFVKFNYSGNETKEIAIGKPNTVYYFSGSDIGSYEFKSSYIVG